MATTIKAMLNTDRVSKSGYYPIVIRVIHNRKKRLFYTLHKVKKGDFDMQIQKVVWSAECSFTKRKKDEMNRDITSKIRELERVNEQLSKNGADFTAKDIIGLYKQNRVNLYFFVFAQKEINAKENVGKFGTAELYKSTISSFQGFIINEKLKFSDITYSILKAYSEHLLAKGLSHNTINMYMRNIRTIYNKAIKEHVNKSTTSPFAELKLNTLPTSKRAISKEDIRKISTFDLSQHPKLDLVRDVFMFSFYTRGMSFIDVVFLRYTDIVSGVIYYKRNKTQQHIQVSVTPQLKKIIDKYRRSSLFILPFLNPEDKRTLYIQYRRALFIANKLLKELGDLIGIETPLTTYVARHSWATIAKNMGGSIAAISEGLGHTTERTTQIYLKAFDNSVIDTLNAKVAGLK